MLRTSKVFWAAALLITSASSVSMQGEGWKTASGAGLKFDVPRDFQTTSGTAPGHLSDGQSMQLFELHYLSAANTQRFVFASAGFGYVQISPFYRGDMDDLASDSLSKILRNLAIPGVGNMVLDLDNAEVASYETMGIQVSETKATSVATRREYRVYFALAFRRASNGRAKMVYIVTGCPERDIEGTNQVLSTILSSFKEPG